MTRDFEISQPKTAFASAADDFAERSLDLHQLLVPRPAATFFLRVSGDTWNDHGIFDGDILVVDRSCAVTRNCFMVVVVDGELKIQQAVSRDVDGEVWGVITATIHQFV